jgi:hypothetical protein
MEGFVCPDRLTGVNVFSLFFWWGSAGMETSALCMLKHTLYPTSKANLDFCFVLVVLQFELGALHLLAWCSTN